MSKKDLELRLYGAYVRAMEKKGKKLLAKTISQAEADGYTVTFTGVYKQGVIEKPEVNMPVPFAVAQMHEQIKKLDEGVLEGRIYDGGRYASVEGTISSESVQFVKKYDPASQTKPGLKSRLFLRVLGYKPGDTRLNPFPIRYAGQNQGDGVYKGAWGFSPADDNKIKNLNELETQGRFTMTRVNPVNKG